MAHEQEMTDGAAMPVAGDARGAAPAVPGRHHVGEYAQVDTMAWTGLAPGLVAGFRVGRTRSFDPMPGYSFADEDEFGIQLHTHGGGARRPVLVFPGQAMRALGGPREVLRIIDLLCQGGGSCSRIDLSMDMEGEITPQAMYAAWRDGRIDSRFERFRGRHGCSARWLNSVPDVKNVLTLPGTGSLPLMASQEEAHVRPSQQGHPLYLDGQWCRWRLRCNRLAAATQDIKSIGSALAGNPPHLVTELFTAFSPQPVPPH